VDDVVGRHRAACEGFSAIVRQGEGKWDRPSPCDEWDARSIVEHVIGFHDVLLLRPMGAKPPRPRGDPVERWAVTVPAIFTAIDRALAAGSETDGGSAEVDVGRLLPVLTTDVVVHTWDLARAIDVDPRLDNELCELCDRVVRPNDERLRASKMFGPAVPVPDGSDAATRLVAFLGRDPGWTP